MAVFLSSTLIFRVMSRGRHRTQVANTHPLGQTTDPRKAELAPLPLGSVGTYRRACNSNRGTDIVLSKCGALSVVASSRFEEGGPLVAPCFT